MDNNSIAHTKWNCTYHIVFIPKYRKKVFYGQMRKDLVEIIRKLCEMKTVELIKGAACVDHVHLYLGIPPKLNISNVVAYIKGKSALLRMWGICKGVFRDSLKPMTFSKSIICE